MRSWLTPQEIAENKRKQEELYKEYARREHIKALEEEARMKQEALERDPHYNRFKHTTTEYKIFNDILRAIKLLDENKELIPEYGGGLDFVASCLYPTVNNRFKKMVINEFVRESDYERNGRQKLYSVPLSFPISHYEYEIYQQLVATTKQTQEERFKAFMYQSLPILNELHKLITRNKHKYNPKDRVNHTETIKKILLQESTIYRQQPLSLNQLVEAINDRLIGLYLTMTFKEMYLDYLDHIPKRIIKTKTIIKNPIKEIEAVNLNSLPPPWTSSYKANDYFKRNKWESAKIEDWRDTKNADSFDYKKQSKNYMLSCVAPRHSFIIDYFFPGKFIYLLAVNINTRKAYAIPSPEIREIQEERFIITKTNNKTAKAACNQLRELLKLTEIKHIVCDQEGGFMSVMFHKLCEENDIELMHYHKNNVKDLIATTESSRGIHGILSILDRLCRTIRRMNYNIDGNASINPRIMNMILEEYNNSPHKTLTSIMKCPITPNMADSNKKLEDEIVFNIMRSNLKRKLKQDPIIGCYVMVINESSKFDKVKTKLLPGIWKVIEYVDGLYVCKNGPNQIKLPRWCLKIVNKPLKPFNDT